MKFEERLNALISEVEVPDELSPQNIAAMLKAETKQSHVRADKKNIRMSANASAQRRTIMIRTAAAAAACTVFAAGMLAYNSSERKQQEIEERIEYEAVSPDSYDDLYNIYTDIYLNGGGSDRPDGYGNETAVGDETASPDKPIEYSVTVPDMTEIPDSGFTDMNGSELSVSGSDIVKSDGKYMYCIKDKTLYIVSLETMETVSQIDCALDPPIEFYIDGDSLILVSTETGERQAINSAAENAAPDVNVGNSPTGSDVPANDPDTYQPTVYNNSDMTEQKQSDDKTSIQNSSAEEADTLRKGVTKTSGISTAVEIYDVTDRTAPIHKTSYKQNGSCIASRLADGKLYTVTAYTDYRVKPLDEQADLDSFVPAYYIDGEKFFPDAGDIIVPAGANSTDYTVISAIDTETLSVSVQAVLGTSSNVYCSADTLYIAGSGKRDREYSIISAFDLTENGIKYRSGGSVEGTALGGQSMNEYEGNFRIATKITDEDGITSHSVYVLDKTLTVINSAGQLLPNVNVTAVRFEGKYAKLFDGENAAEVLDLSSYPPTLTKAQAAEASYLYNYSENRLLGIGKAEPSGISLTMYDTETGITVGSIIFAEDESEIFSKIFTDRRAALIDSDNGIIGIPIYTHTEFGTKNCYYVFEFADDVGFISKGKIEYTDIDDSFAFERGSVSGDVLYITSPGRIIAAQKDDLKIIGVYDV